MLAPICRVAIAGVIDESANPAELAKLKIAHKLVRIAAHARGTAFAATAELVIVESARCVIMPGHP